MSQLATDPTQALAYATASLEVADSSAARSMVMQALWQGPPVRVFVAHAHDVRFSPEGGWIATTAFGSEAGVWSKEGEGPIELYGLEATTKRNTSQWSSESLLVTGFIPAERLQLWSIPEARLVRTIELGAPSFWQVEGGHLYAETFMNGPAGAGEAAPPDHWRLPVGGPEELGRVDRTALGIGTNRWYTIFHPSGEAWLYGRDHTISARPLPIAADDADRVIGTHDGDDVWFVSNHSKGDNLVSCDGTTGELRVWSLSDSDPGPRRVIPRPRTAPESSLLFPDPRMRWLYRGAAWQTGMGLLWDLNGLPGAEPLAAPAQRLLAALVLGLRSRRRLVGRHHTRRRAGGLLAAAQGLPEHREGRVLHPQRSRLQPRWPVAGHRLAATSREAFPTAAYGAHRTATAGQAQSLLQPGLRPHGRVACRGGVTRNSACSVVPLGGGDHRGGSKGSEVDDRHRVAGRILPERAAGRGGLRVSAFRGEAKLRARNLDTGRKRGSFELPEGRHQRRSPAHQGPARHCAEPLVHRRGHPGHGGRHALPAMGPGRRIVPRTDPRPVDPVDVPGRLPRASADVQRVLMLERTSQVDPMRIVCDTPDAVRPGGRHGRGSCRQFGDCVRAMALDTTGTVAVTGDNSGSTASAGLTVPHLISSPVTTERSSTSPSRPTFAGSPRSVPTPPFASGPCPTSRQPPLHTLPHDELIAKLKSLTNLRAVRDEESSTRLEDRGRPDPRMGGGAGMVKRNFGFWILNFGFPPARPPLSDFGFANFEFWMSARPAHPDARCWILDAGSTHPPWRATQNVGASFRVRQRVVPRIDVAEETQRAWWRALKDPPTKGSAFPGSKAWPGPQT